MPLVTVVTAAKNAAPFIGETIESIRAQTLTDFAHVVVDDGSTDDTAVIVEAAAATDARVRLLRLDESIGPYAAANRVMLGADSEYLARIDADDLAVPRRLEHQVQELSRNPNADACASAFQTLTADGVDSRVRLAPSRLNGALKWMFWQRNGLPHSSLTIRTRRFVDIGGYGPSRVAEDFALWARLARDRQISVSDLPLVRYRVWPGQITAASNVRDQPERIALQLTHLRACDDGPWTMEDARDFWLLGRRADYPVKRAMELIDGWVRAWERDTDLSEDERHELRGYAAHRRAGHLRHAFRSSPSEVLPRMPLALPSILRAATATRESRQRWR